MKEIAELLLKLSAVELDTENGFTYASGIKSPIYCDNRVIISYPQERSMVVDAFLKLINEKKLSFDIIAGVATSGIPWAAIIAERLQKPLVYVRASAKDHGKENKIEGEIEEGKSVLVIEDLISTGGSSLGACKALQDSPCSVIACLAIFNYGLDISAKSFSEAKIPLYSLSDFSELLRVAVETKYIEEKEKKSLLNWHKHPKQWKPKPT
ncbi:orotate phosphoribosyltransferase [Candidatus Woesearchaeota archaeon]|nr:orotate phosphoribosyltransferase [Candidatus Woesearchaeota archaeon]